MNCNVSMVLMMMIPIRIDAEFDDFEVRWFDMQYITRGGSLLVDLLEIRGR